MYGNKTYGWFFPTDESSEDDRDTRRSPLYQLDRWDLEVRWLDPDTLFDFDHIIFKEDVRRLSIATNMHLDLSQLGDIPEIGTEASAFASNTLRKLWITKHTSNSIDIGFLDKMYPYPREFLFEKLVIAGGPLKEIEFTPFDNNYEDSKFYSLSIRDSSIDEFDITPLRRHQSFKEFEFQDTSIRSLDLTPYTTLQRIKVESCNKLTSVLLPKSDSHSLEIIDCPLEEIDLTPISDSTYMKTLVLKDNKLKGIDLTPLFDNWQLTHVDLRGNPMEEVDITPLFNLFNVESLEVPEDTSPIAKREVTEEKLRNKGVKSIIDRTLLY